MGKKFLQTFVIVAGTLCIPHGNAEGSLKTENCSKAYCGCFWSSADGDKYCNAHPTLYKLCLTPQGLFPSDYCVFYCLGFTTQLTCESS